MPKNENWDKKPLTELLDTIVDNRGKSVPTSETGFPLIATNCIKHSSIYPMFENIRYVSDETLKTWFRAELKPNDILFVNKGSPGRVCLVPNPVPFCAAQDMVGLRCNPKKVYYKYLFAYLRTPIIQQKIENYHVGIMIPHFKKSDMDNLLIELPEMPIQRKIGDLYLLLSEKIELNNKISADLESLAKTIYDYWFLQFEFPDANGRPYKSSGGRMVWNEALKREVPEGWKYKKLDNHISFSRGIAYTSNDIKDKSGLPMFNLASVDISRNYQPNGLKYYSGKYKKDDIIYPGDFVIACTDLTRNRDIIGSPVCVPNTHDKFVSSMDLAKLNITSNELIGYYVYSALRQESYHNYIKWFASGTNVQHLDLDGILNYPILFPDINIQKKYSDIIHNLEKKKGIILKENQDLAALRDFLLPMLMNGQVTFKDEKECPA